MIFIELEKKKKSIRIEVKYNYFHPICYLLLAVLFPFFKIFLIRLNECEFFPLFKTNYAAISEYETIDSNLASFKIFASSETTLRKVG